MMDQETAAELKDELVQKLGEIQAAENTRKMEAAKWREQISRLKADVELIRVSLECGEDLTDEIREKAHSMTKKRFSAALAELRERGSHARMDLVFGDTGS